MNKLDWYIVRSVLKAILAVTLILCGLFIIFDFVAESANIGVGNYTVWAAMTYTLESLPINIYIGMPILALLGTLISLGNMATNRELTIMQVSGMSIQRISLAVVYAGIIVMVISFVVGAFVGPYLEHTAQATKATKQNQHAVLMTVQSAWIRDGDDFIRIGAALPTGELKDVVKYTVVNNELKKVTYAKTAVFHSGVWHLKDVSVSNLSDHNTLIKRQSLKDLIWKTSVGAGLINILVASPSTLSLPALYSFIQYREENNLSVASYNLTFWNLFFQPLSILILMVISVPFVFGPLRSSTFGLRLVIGLVVGFGFFIANQFFGPFAIVYNLPPFMGASLPFLLFLLIYLGFLAWIRWR